MRMRNCCSRGFLVLSDDACRCKSNLILVLGCMSSCGLVILRINAMEIEYCVGHFINDLEAFVLCPTFRSPKDWPANYYHSSYLCRSALEQSTFSRVGKVDTISWIGV